MADRARSRRPSSAAQRKGPSVAERRRLRRVRLGKRVRASLIGRTIDFLPLPVLLLLALGAVVLIPTSASWLLLDRLQRARYGEDKIASLDEVVRKAETARESPYCRKLFANGPLYAGCFSRERIMHGRYYAAWKQNRDFSTIRDHLIECYDQGQQQQGTSWQVVARCAEVDTSATAKLKKDDLSPRLEPTMPTPST